MEKLVAEEKKRSMDSVSDHDRIWYLVNMILIEKGYFIDGVLRGGNLSEDLLEKIGEVLRERAEKGIEWKEERIHI